MTLFVRRANKSTLPSLRENPSYYRCLSTRIGPLLVVTGLGVSVSAQAQEQTQDQAPNQDPDRPEIPPETTDPGDEYRDDARRLATEAATHYEAGEYALALDLFLRAGKLYDAPTLKFWQARCLEQLGRLVDAEARYAEVARTNVEGDAPEAFLNAQRESEAALAELRKRLPTITVIVHNAKDISRVELDGRVLPPPLVGAPVAVDPGTHVIKVTRSSGPEQVESVAIVESQAQVVHVNFETPNQTPLLPIMTPASEEPESTSNWRTTVGFSSLGLGAVGLGVGVFVGLAAMNKHKTLEANCPDDKCDDPFHDDVDSFHQLKTISTVGYAVGIVGVGAGAVLLLTGDHGQTTAIELHPDGASLRHMF
jgi:hypothetical protein